MGRVVQSSIERLISNLKLLSVNTEVPIFLIEEKDGKYLDTASDNFIDYASDELRNLTNLVIEDLNEWLITDSGHHDIPGREICKRNGFSFTKGLEDNMGVITAIINIGNFKLTYGERLF